MKRNHQERKQNMIKIGERAKEFLSFSFSFSLCIFLKKREEKEKEKKPIYNKGYIFLISPLPTAERFASSLTILVCHM